MRKKINLQEASQLTGYEKMCLFDQGQRRENLKACSSIKLVTYYNICLNNGLKNAEKQIKAEMLRRGGLDLYIWPDIDKIDSTQFTPYEAQLLLKHEADLDIAPIVTDLYLHPFPSLTATETLLVYLVWAIVLDLPKFVQQIKQYFNKQLYYAKVPQMLNDIINKPGTIDIISDITKKLI